MGDFIYFTEEQKERTNAVQIADILRREHEEVERSGNEWRWKRHRSVTFRGSSWYRHSRQGIDRKLARKIRQKKIAQGHAVDDHENMVQTQ